MNKTAKIITNDVLSSHQFAEYYTGLYFTHCHTFNETKQCLSSQQIYISDGYLLSDIPKAIMELPVDTPTVIVQFSTENNFTEYEYRLMRIQKKYLSRFIKNMNNDKNINV